jgi:hypothetical protein
MGLKEVPLPLKTLLHVRAYLYPKGMSEDEDIIISCTVCGATALKIAEAMIADNIKKGWNEVAK